MALRSGGRSQGWGTGTLLHSDGEVLAWYVWNDWASELTAIQVTSFTPHEHLRAAAISSQKSDALHRMSMAHYFKQEDIKFGVTTTPCPSQLFWGGVGVPMMEVHREKPQSHPGNSRIQKQTGRQFWAPCGLFHLSHQCISIPLPRLPRFRPVWV